MYFVNRVYISVIYEVLLHFDGGYASRFKMRSFQYFLNSKNSLNIQL